MFVGQGDLATRMGLKARSDHPQVLEAVQKLEEAIRGSSVLLGGVAQSVERANEMIARGYRALVIGFDWSLLQKGIAVATGGINR